MFLFPQLVVASYLSLIVASYLSPMVISSYFALMAIISYFAPTFISLFIRLFLKANPAKKTNAVGSIPCIGSSITE